MKRPWLLLPVVIFVLLCAGCASTTDLSFSEIPTEDGTMWIHFYPGAGDCTFIRFPNGETMLVDACNRASGEEIAKDLRERGVKYIDYLIISHYHSDHVSGLREILPDIKIGQAYSNGYYPTDFAWVNELLENNGTPVKNLFAGDSLEIGGVRIDVLWPVYEDVAQLPQNVSTVLLERGSVRDLNNHSLVCRMTYGNNSILFTGDIYEKGENEIIDYYASNPEIIDCDVLKVMHHGRDTSSGEAFIRAVSPQYGFAMGYYTMLTNYYLRYYTAGCRVFIDGQNGNAYVTMDGENITVHADNPEINAAYKRYTDVLDRAGKEIE